jgi:hypothetical protein
LEKLRLRIVNEEQLSTQKVCFGGSGAVESAVKQIDRRLKISGLLWLMKNVNQMRSLRCTLTAQYPFDAQKRKTGMLQVRLLPNFIG